MLSWVLDYWLELYSFFPKQLNRRKVSGLKYGKNVYVSMLYSIYKLYLYNLL